MISEVLKGKKILFFSWPFYQYPLKIEETLRKMGAEVTTYLSAPTNNFLAVRFLEKFEVLKKNYFKNIMEEISTRHFDYVFMINAAVFPEYFLQELSDICKDSCKLLYSWDSLAVYPKAQTLFKYFDYVYSFDSDDVEKNKELEFLPLFYCDDLQNVNKNAIYKYDFSFVGFGHTDRYKFIKSIQSFADQNDCTYYFKLYLPSLMHYIRGKYIKEYFKDAKIKDFIYKPISHDKLKKITEESKIVVDLELSNQSGLTMRTIETHGMRKKLITTNENIKKYDFYNENNICIVDRNNPIISQKFIESDYQMLPEILYDKYSLSQWLKTIFKV